MASKQRPAVLFCSSGFNPPPPPRSLHLFHAWVQVQRPRQDAVFQLQEQPGGNDGKPTPDPDREEGEKSPFVCAVRRGLAVNTKV